MPHHVQGVDEEIHFKIVSPTQIFVVEESKPSFCVHEIKVTVFFWCPKSILHQYCTAGRY
jgi:hypothetical protein